MGYSFRLAVRVLLYTSSHKQDNTYYNLCYTSRGALAGTRNNFTKLTAITKYHLRIVLYYFNFILLLCWGGVGLIFSFLSLLFCCNCLGREVCFFVCFCFVFGFFKLWGFFVGGFRCRILCVEFVCC